MASRKKSPDAHSITLPDGTKLKRKYKKSDDGRREPYGNWLWVVYDPDRRPRRKQVNLYTRDQSVAYSKAMELSQRRATGTFDPWADTAPERGVTVAEAARRYLAWKKRRGAADSTVETDRGHLDRLDRWLPAGSLVRHVEQRHVEGFLDRPKRGGGQRSPAGQARALATLQHFFGWALGEGLIGEDPTASVVVAQPKAERRDHVTEAEEGAILKAISAAEVLSGEPRDWLRDWLLFGVGTGLRPGEQRELKWSAVRIAEQTVDVGLGHAVKTKESRRVVPVAGAALGVLHRRAATRSGEGDGPVFTGAGGAPVNVGYLSKQLQRFAKEAGVEKNVTAYSLRHSYGTRMALAGTPLYILAQMMGTSVAMIEKHYGHFDPERGAAHVARVFGNSTPRRPRTSGRHSARHQTP